MAPRELVLKLTPLGVEVAGTRHRWADLTTAFEGETLVLQMPGKRHTWAVAIPEGKRNSLQEVLTEAKASWDPKGSPLLVPDALNSLREGVPELRRRPAHVGRSTDGEPQ